MHLVGCTKGMSYSESVAVVHSLALCLSEINLYYFQFYPRFLQSLYEL